MPRFYGGGNEDVSSEDILKILAGELVPADIRARRERAEHMMRQNLERLQYAQLWSQKTTRSVLYEFRCVRFRGGGSDCPHYAEDVLRDILSRREHIHSTTGSRREHAKRRHGMNKSKNR